MSVFYLARLTHNQNDWKKPSGPDYKSGDCNNKNPAHEALYDFGFEEWLFDPTHQMGGYQYGYIEGISSKREKHPILLYTFKFEQNRKGPTTRLAVAKIENWDHVLNRINNGSIAVSKWHGEMVNDLTNSLSGNPKLKSSINQINQHSIYSPNNKPLFNIRFKPVDVSYCYKQQIGVSPLIRHGRFIIMTRNSDQIPANILQAYGVI